MSMFNNQFSTFPAPTGNPFGATGPLGDLAGYNQQGGGGFDVPPGYAQIGNTNQAVRTVPTQTGPIRYFRDLIDPGGGLTGPEQVRLGGMSDFMKTEAANIYNYGQTMEGIRNMEDAVITGAQDIRDQGQKAQDQFFGFAGGLQDLGQETFDMVKGRVEKTEQDFFNDSAQLLSLSQKGEKAALRTGLQQLQSEVDAGNPMALDAQRRMRAESMDQTSQRTMQFGSDYNRAASALSSQGTGQILSAANTQQGYESMASNMNQMGVAAMQSATAQAANFEVQGLSQVAQMIASNPYNPVAFLPTLMAQFQFDETPGSSGFTGFSGNLLG